MDFITQNFDTIFKIVTASFVAFGFFLALRNEISIIKVDIKYIKQNQTALADAFTQLGTILTTVAVQDNRILMLEKKVDELSHGQGFVKIN